MLGAFVAATVFFALVTAGHSGVPPMGAPSTADSSVWAVLIAGSKEWYNYRYHSDVCRTYQ